ncbi:MAG: glutathione S-transferase family protein [Alphaproteobacteria bacterium]
MPSYTLISHPLCPYVQRAVIALTEKGVPFTRHTVDLSDKPAWFLDLSPQGKVPLLLVEVDGHRETLFESAAILEYLEEVTQNPLHPDDPVRRAQHRAWMEFGSGILNDIAGFYNAADEAALQAKAAGLRAKFERLNRDLGAGPWFDGAKFSLVDTVFGPIFRYFDTFDGIADFGILSGRRGVAAWRAHLAARPSVRDAVGVDYPDLLMDFLIRRNSALSRLIPAATVSAVPATR